MSGNAPDTAAARYLTLLKQTLTFTLWPEPLEPLEHFNAERAPLKRLAVRLAAGLLRPLHLQLAKAVAPTWEERRDGRHWPYSAHTMMGLTRLDHLQGCIETVLRESIPGDFIETGVWRGGGCIFMRGALAAHGVTDRKVYVADSFNGFPAVEAAADAGDEPEKFHSYLAVPQATVQENFRKYGLLDDQVVFLPGWFKDTLPVAPIAQLAILRLDGDMYSSTMDALTALYPKLSPGGFCIVDDYGAIPPCKQAITDYRAAHGITAALVEIDWAGVFWRKGPSA